ncbi:MAG: RdgB/HAM1 family non-canonical purine NTP pyrophosphatase [Acidimicrobiales bacterium]|nr:RdgB/HAM1 family non-canonical purine NTP pyrophosphatase [Acidimicrobiales bacterium]HRW39100.1 RdgB/HAM1 family non-canonical purine NTP pyrophosphatase [Aquihabitans sp.]
MTFLPPGTPVVLASANPKKAGEIAEILGDAVALVPRPPEVPDVVEDADTFEGNARLKAVALVEATGLAALADDSGLQVDALGGEPGVFSARYAGEGASDADNVTKLLAALKAAGAIEPAARTARFRAVLVLRRPDGAEVVTEGVVEGTIAPTPRGGGGFGYDPVFVPDDGDGRTFAEMDSAAKHAISHRGRSLRALVDLL